MPRPQEGPTLPRQRSRPGHSKEPSSHRLVRAHAEDFGDLRPVVDDGDVHIQLPITVPFLVRQSVAFVLRSGRVLADCWGEATQGKTASMRSVHQETALSPFHPESVADSLIETTGLDLRRLRFGIATYS